MERLSLLEHWVVVLGPGAAAPTRFFDKLVHFNLLLGGLLASEVVFEMDLAPFVGRPATAHGSVNQRQVIQLLA